MIRNRRHNRIQLPVPGRPTTLAYGRAGAGCACRVGCFFFFCFFFVCFFFVVVVVFFVVVFFFFFFFFFCFFISSILSSFLMPYLLGDGWTY